MVFIMYILKLLLFVLCFQWSYLSDPSSCEIDLECRECLPENMPLVTWPGGGEGVGEGERGGNGTVRVRSGDEVTFGCAGGTFLMYPLHSTLHARCEAGRYRLRHDTQLRHLLQLGCQESVFEDVLHDVPHCAPPLQGRVYRVRGSVEGAGAGGVTHLATLCFDSDAGVARWSHASSAGALRLPPHEERAAPLSLLGNFDHMFDASTRHAAERLYADEPRLNRRLRIMFEHERFSFAEQELGSAALLSRGYFDERMGDVTDLVSNRVAVWRSVAAGNLRHVHRDVAALLRRSRSRSVAGAVDVYVGTHEVATLNAGSPRPELYLKAGRRFPVPRYIWTAVHAPATNRGVALVVLNDPLVTVSEVRAAVFCESACGSVTWLRHLTRHRNYERPVNGLAFCCHLRDFAAHLDRFPPIFNETTTLLD